MKKINSTYRIIALTMAFVMFATSVNLAIDMHYCQGELKSVSFLGEAQSCNEINAAKAVSCPHHKRMMVEKEACSKDEKNCCSSKQIHIQSDDDQLNSNSEIAISQELQQFVVAYVEVFFQNISIQKTTLTFHSYLPPIIQRDIYALFETFIL